MPTLGASSGGCGESCVTGAVDYSGRMSKVYDAGRSLSPKTLAQWTEAASHHLVVPDGIVLDLGSGTSRFSAPLAERLERPVIALEPAAGMRERARGALAGRVSLVCGRAEAIPLRSGACALVWMSQAIHHVDDLDLCAAELRLVTAKGARVLLRGIFDVRHWVLAPYFPAAVRVGENQFPPLEVITAAFARAGLTLVAHDRIDQVTVATAEELLARIRLRADSALARISDEEFASGLARLTVDIAQGLIAGPVVDHVDFVAFA